MSRLGRFLRGSPRFPPPKRPPAKLKEIEAARPEDKPEPRAAEEVPEVPAAPARWIKWRECIQWLLQADGYVVQGSSEELSKGSSVRMWGSDSGFRISGPASYEDALRQWKIYRERIGEEMEPPPAPSSGWRYYKFVEVPQGTRP